MNKLTILGGAGIVVALVLSVLAITNQPTQTVVERVVERQLAGMPGDTLPGPGFEVAGLKHTYFSSGIQPASSTDPTANEMCSFRITATSTLVSAKLRIDANEAYINYFEIGVGTDRHSTTTSLVKWTVAASVPAEIMATTSGAKTIANGWILIPGRYINFKVATATPSTTFNPKGKCTVELEEF